MSPNDQDTWHGDADPVSRLRTVTGRVPPDEVAAFYRAAEATDVEGMPLVVVGPEPRSYPWKMLKHRSKDAIYVNERYAELLAQNQWPMAEDGCGGMYVALERDGAWRLGFIDPLKVKSVALDTSWSSVSDFRRDILSKLRPE